jgi:hypothetical protein
VVDLEMDVSPMSSKQVRSEAENVSLLALCTNALKLQADVQEHGEH